MHADRKIERHLLYWICIAVTLVGVCLIILSFHIQKFAPEIRSIGTTLCSVGVIGFIFQYYFQTCMENRIVEILSELKKSIVPEVAREAEKLGIKRFLFGRYEFDAIRLNLYNEARNVSWLANGVNLPVQYNFIEEISNCLQNGVNFRFLTSANCSAIQDVIKRLMELKNKKRSGRIQVKIYEGHPRWYIQIIDNKIYAQPYLHDVEISKAPMFEIEEGEKGEGFYEYFWRHFEVVWRDAIPLEQFLLDFK